MNSNLQKLQQAKKQYDDLEGIRLKASNLFDNEKYLVCVHLHYDKVVVISCGINGTYPIIYASFEMMIDDGHVTPIERRHYTDQEIEDMMIFIEGIVG
jgi:hypothetical protein